MACLTGEVTPGSRNDDYTEIGKGEKPTWGSITEVANRSGRGSKRLRPPRIIYPKDREPSSPISWVLTPRGKLTCTSGPCLFESQLGPQIQQDVPRWKVTSLTASFGGSGENEGARAGLRGISCIMWALSKAFNSKTVKPEFKSTHRK